MGILQRVLDVISRPNYAMAEGSRRVGKATREGQPVHRVLDDFIKGLGGGITGRNKTTYADVLEEGGVGEGAGRTALGMALDIGLDPSTYIGVGGLAKAAKPVAKEAIKRKIGGGLTEDVGRTVKGIGDPAEHVGDRLTRMYHGTGPEEAESILKGGFKPSESGAYGPGVYLADDPTTAAVYGDDIIEARMRNRDVNKLMNMGNVEDLEYFSGLRNNLIEEANETGVSSLSPAIQRKIIESLQERGHRGVVNPKSPFGKTYVSHNPTDVEVLGKVNPRHIRPIAGGASDDLMETLRKLGLKEETDMYGEAVSRINTKFPVEGLPKSDFDEAWRTGSSELGYLEDLMKNIDEFGIRQPLEIVHNRPYFAREGAEHVRKLRPGLTLEDGHHRLAIARRLGKEHVPANLRMYGEIPDELAERATKFGGKPGFDELDVTEDVLRGSVDTNQGNLIADWVDESGSVSRQAVPAELAQEHATEIYNKFGVTPSYKMMKFSPYGNPVS